MNKKAPYTNSCFGIFAIRQKENREDEIKEVYKKSDFIFQHSSTLVILVLSQLIWNKKESTTKNALSDIVKMKKRVSEWADKRKQREKGDEMKREMHGK